MKHYSKDKTNIVKFRLNDTNYEFVKRQCEVYNMSISDYIRLLIEFDRSRNVIIVEKDNENV